MKKNHFFSVLLFTMFAFSVLSCSSAPSDCTGEIAAGGNTYTAKSSSADEALRNACNKYCLETDSECDAMYQIWVNSPKGKAAGSPPKMRALSEEKKLLDCVTVKCADKCMADVKAGILSGKSNCQ